MAESEITAARGVGWVGKAEVVFLYLLPPVAWMATLIAMGSDVGSGGNTQRLLASALDAFGLAHYLSPAAIDAIHVGLRKLGHFTAYALLGVLLARLVRRVKARLTVASAVACWFASLGQAAADEWHQSLYGSRTATVLDVGIDVLGAAAGITLYRMWMSKCRKP